MAIKGSLREASLPDVMQLLFLGRRSGCLAVADRQSHGSIFFEDGWVTHAAIVNRRDRLGDVLVKSGRITPGQLEEAMQAQRTMPERRLGELLVSLGALSQEELARQVRVQVEEAVYTLFTWQSGTFSFEAGVKPDAGELPCRINPESMLLEGARRVDEWALIEKKIPSFDLIFGVEHEPDDTLEFTEAQRRLLTLLDGRRDVRALIEDSGLSEFDAGQALFGLLTAGLIQRVGTSTQPAANRLQESQIEEHRNLGIAFYRTGMLDEAVREFRRVAELRPAEGNAPFYLGLIALRQSRWDDAAEQFRRAADRAGPRPAILHNLGLALEYAGRLDQAEAVLADAVARGRDDPRLLLTWGCVALRRGDPGAAVLRLERAAAVLTGTRPAPWYWAMGRALAARGDLDGAIRIAREALEAYPAQAPLRNTLAVLLEATGDVEESERLLHDALADEPTLPQISKNLGDLCYRSGRYDEAFDFYERAAKLDAELGDDLYFKMGNLALKRHDAAHARTCWEHALALNPDHQLARANLASLETGP